MAAFSGWAFRAGGGEGSKLGLAEEHMCDCAMQLSGLSAAPLPQLLDTFVGTQAFVDALRSTGTCIPASGGGPRPTRSHWL